MITDDRKRLSTELHGIAARLPPGEWHDRVRGLADDAWPSPIPSWLRTARYTLTDPAGYPVATVEVCMDGSAVHLEAGAVHPSAAAAIASAESRLWAAGWAPAGPGAARRL